MERTRTLEKVLPEEFSGELLAKNPVKARQILETTLRDALNAHKEQLNLLITITNILELGYDRYGWLRRQEGGGDFFRETEIKFRDANNNNMIILEELAERYRGDLPKMSLEDKNLWREKCQCEHESVVLELIEKQRSVKTRVIKTAYGERLSQVKNELNRISKLKVHCGRIEFEIELEEI